MEKGKVNFLIGLSFGSEGKGNVAAYLGSNYDLDLAINNNGANSGHVCVIDGEKVTCKHLPTSGLFNDKTNIILGNGSVMNLDVLLDEIEKHSISHRIIIGAYAPMINDLCREMEKEHLNYIASTFQGVGAALSLKVMRSKSVRLVKDIPELEKYCHADIADVILNRIGKHGHTALAEVAQGYGLSLDGGLYPFCTSRNVNIGQSLAYLDIPHSLVGDRYGVVRTYPIRVGNVPDGYSGDGFFDQEEISWESLSEKLGEETVEFTTVTKRKRRIFSFSKFGFKKAVERNDINKLFITFWDYLTEEERDPFLDEIMSVRKFDAVYVCSGPDHTVDIERVV